MDTLYGFDRREPDLRRTDRSGTYEAKALWQVHHEIIALALTGMKSVDIAEQLDVTPATVSNCLNSRLARAKLSRMRKSRDEEFIDVQHEVRRLAEKAIATYEEIFDDETAGYKLKKEVADTVLMDLGGHRAPTKIDQRSLHAHLTKQEIEDLVRRGDKVSKDLGFSGKESSDDSDV